MRFDVAAALETLESGPPRMRVGGSWGLLTPGPVLSGQDDQTTYRAIIPGEVSRLNEQLGVIRVAPSAAVRQRLRDASKGKMAAQRRVRLGRRPSNRDTRGEILAAAQNARSRVRFPGLSTKGAAPQPAARSATCRPILSAQSRIWSQFR